MIKSIKNLLLDYYKLSKPGIVFLLVLVSIAGYIVSVKTLEIVRLIILIISGAFASGGSAMINNYLDKERDKKMKRTMKRPLPAGRVKSLHVLIIGVILIISSLIISFTWLGFMTSIFIILGALIYLYIYTILLKPRTPLNIVIGGFAGSCAALAGSATSGSITITGIILGLLVFIWTPGHFWSLALKFKDDYVNTKIPMLPAISSTETTIKAIIISNISTSLFSLLLIYPFRSAGITYTILSIILTIYIIYLSMKLSKQPTSANSIKLFKTSNMYLTILCITLIFDTIIKPQAYFLNNCF
jgi:protoheme IX farnesyltransferase